MSGRAQGPEPGPARPAFLPGPLSRCNTRGLQKAARRSVWSGPGNSGAAPRPGCEPLRSLSFKSPPGTGNRGNAGEMRPRPAIPASTPPARPRPGEPTSRARHVPLRSPRFPATPRPSTRSPAQVRRGGRTPRRLRERSARSAPHAGSEEGLSPPPLLPSLPVSPLLSPGGEPGKYAGRGRDAGPPPGCAGT